MKNKYRIFHIIFSISVCTTLISLLCMFITVIETGTPEYSFFTAATISTVVMCFSGVLAQSYK